MKIRLQCNPKKKMTFWTATLSGIIHRHSANTAIAQKSDVLQYCNIVEICLQWKYKKTGKIRHFIITAFEQQLHTVTLYET